MIPKLMWLHFSPVSPFVLLVFTPGRAFPLAGRAPPLLQTPLGCGLAGRPSLAATAGAGLALTRSPPPLEGLPFPSSSLPSSARSGDTYPSSMQ